MEREKELIVLLKNQKKIIEFKANKLSVELSLTGDFQDINSIKESLKAYQEYLIEYLKLKT